MIGKFSVSFLTQSFNVHDDSPRESFEHLIALYNFTEEVSQEELIEVVKQQNYMSPYETADGSFVYVKVIKVIDIFEIFSDVQFEKNAEVYSRFFINEGTSEDILRRYFSDFILEDKI